jgi:hypothetical protein
MAEFNELEIKQIEDVIETKPQYSMTLMEFRVWFIDRVSMLSPELDDYLARRLDVIDNRDGDAATTLSVAFNTACEALYDYVKSMGVELGSAVEDMFESRVRLCLMVDLANTLTVDGLINEFSQLTDDQRDELEMVLQQYWSSDSDHLECLSELQLSMFEYLPLSSFWRDLGSVIDLLIPTELFVQATQVAFERSHGRDIITDQTVEVIGKTLEVISKARVCFANLWTEEMAGGKDKYEKDVRDFAKGLIEMVIDQPQLQGHMVVDIFAKYVKQSRLYLPFYVEHPGETCDKQTTFLVACTIRAWLESCVTEDRTIVELLKDSAWLIPIEKVASWRKFFSDAFAKYLPELAEVAS